MMVIRWNLASSASDTKTAGLIRAPAVRRTRRAIRRTSQGDASTHRDACTCARARTRHAQQVLHAWPPPLPAHPPSTLGMHRAPLTARRRARPSPCCRAEGHSCICTRTQPTREHCCPAGTAWADPASSGPSRHRSLWQRRELWAEQTQGRTAAADAGLGILAGELVRCSPSSAAAALPPLSGFLTTVRRPPLHSLQQGACCRAATALTNAESTVTPPPVPASNSTEMIEQFVYSIQTDLLLLWYQMLYIIEHEH